MRFPISLIAAGLVLVGTVPRTISAQHVSIDIETLRQELINGLERQRMMDVEFARAIPDSALRWAPNPVVRDFAEQVAHGANNLFLGRFVGKEAPAFGDTAVYLNDKEELAQAVTRAYNWVIKSLRELSAEDLLVETNIFGQTVPKWRVYLFATEHAIWTRGQLVPYFRAHGLAPPQTRFF